MQGVAVGETLTSFLPELSAWHLLTPCKLDIRESLLLSQVDISVSCIESERLRFPLPLPVRDLQDSVFHKMSAHGFGEE